MAKNLVAEICLYGNSEAGHGWLATLKDGVLLGDGALTKSWTATDAIFHACHAVAVRLYGPARWSAHCPGNVRIYEPKGEYCGITTLSHPGYFGDIKWQRAGHYELKDGKVRKVS